MMMETNEDEREKLAQEYLQLLAKEIEPLLKDAKPFFGGKEKMTLAEVCFSIFSFTFTFCRNVS